MEFHLERGCRQQLRVVHVYICDDIHLHDDDIYIYRPLHLSCPVLSSGSNLGGRGPRRRFRARHQLRSREGQGRSVLGPADALQVKNRIFLEPLHLKSDHTFYQDRLGTNIAGKTLKNKSVGVFPHSDWLPTLAHLANLGKETRLWRCHFVLNVNHFTKTGSGQVT